MDKDIILTLLPKDSVYMNTILMERSFVKKLKEKGYLKAASSFEDIPEKFSAEIRLNNENIFGRETAFIKVLTLAPVPESWKEKKKKYENLELIGDRMDFIEFSFQLEIECVFPLSLGENIIIKVPVGLF